MARTLGFALFACLGMVRTSVSQDCTACIATGLNGVGAYYTSNDRFQHAIVANDGSLYEVFFDPRKGIFQSHLARIRETIALAAYSAPTDADRQIVIVARRNGEIHQIWFNPTSGISSAILDQVNGAVDVGGWYSDDDGREHAVVATQTGAIVELAWLPAQGVHRTTLATIPGVTHVAGFFTRDDHFNIVLAATASGAIWEIFYKDPTRIGRSVIQQLADPIVDIAGFYTDDDSYRHAIVGSQSGIVREIFYHPTKGKGLATLATVPGLKHLAAYTTNPTDGWRHVILATSSGQVKELFYDPKRGQGLALLRSYAPETAHGEDVSVDQPNGQPQAFRASISGVVFAVAGDEQVTYAVSLNAGVWRSDNGAAWRQLAASPRRAVSIAVDPANHLHVVVGEREGEAADASVNQTGIWESTNGGVSWTYALDPRVNAGCSAQVVPAVAFDKSSAIYGATACGVVKKPAGGAFQMLAATTGKGFITSVTTQFASGAKWVWARTNNAFLVSADAGGTWDQVAIPATIGTDAVSRGARGDHFSLAAYDQSAFTIATTTRGCATIAYHADSRTWSLSDVKDGDGTGLGGRRFVKAYFVNQANRPWVLLAGTGQGVFLGVPNGTTITWKRIAETPWPLGPGEMHEFNPVSSIHTDLWDTHVSTAVVPAVWLSSDGGVYRSTLTAAIGSAPGVSPPYAPQNQGLHTQHVHTLSLITEGPTRRSKLVYPTSDNDEWLQNSTSIVNPAAAWRTWAQVGDANWSAADNGSSPLALIYRSPTFAELTSFGDPAPGPSQPWAQSPTIFQLYPALHFRGGEFFNFIQTLKGEPEDQLIDAVMLAHQPLANPSANGQTVLIRTTQLGAAPDAIASKLSAPQWTIEDANLPAGAQRVWASGGHQNPTYYLYTEDDNSGDRRLYRRSGAGAPWVDLTPAIGQPLLPSPYMALFGPAFVNPYDRKMLVVMTTAGIRMSHDAGATFENDEVLTALVTGSGTFPLTDRYLGGNGANIVIPSRAVEMATLSNIAFYRDDPRQVVVAAPYTGVFYLDGRCGAWQSLTRYLPQPLTAAAAVGIDHEAVYVAFEGRSLWRVASYEFAPKASYFSRAGVTGSQIAKLLRSDRTAVPAVGVRVVLQKANGPVVFNGIVVTDAAGMINVPQQGGGPWPAGRYVAHLSFKGVAGVAPGEMSIALVL